MQNDKLAKAIEEAKNSSVKLNALVGEFLKHPESKKIPKNVLALVNQSQAMLRVALNGGEVPQEAINEIFNKINNNDFNIK